MRAKLALQVKEQSLPTLFSSVQLTTPLPGAVWDGRQVIPDKIGDTSDLRFNVDYFKTTKHEPLTVCAT